MAAETQVDISQYRNTLGMLELRQKEIADGELRLQQLTRRESAAHAVLASSDSLLSDRKHAEKILEECKQRRANIEVQLERARGTAEIFKKRVAEMQPAYKREQERLRLASRLR